MATKQATKKKDPKEYLFEPVTVTLVKDDLRYTDDVTVTYNGVNYQIKRGIPVEVPRIIQMILDDSLRQKTAATDYSRNLEEKFYQETRRVSPGRK